MKPFDLEKALSGDPVVTRNGQKVLQIHYEENTKFNRSVVAFTEDEGWTRFRKNGKQFDYGDSRLDLFMEATERDGWVNLYRRRGVLFTGNVVLGTEQEAKNAINKDRGKYVATAKVEWEE